MAAPPKLQADEPQFEWVQKDGCNMLLVHLPGYLKENLKVQVTKSRKLRVLREKKINERKSSRFEKEFSLSEECDVSRITAMFEGGILQVRLPKMEAPALQKVEAKHSAAADKANEDKKPGYKADESLTKKNEMVQEGKKAEEARSGKVGEKATGNGNGKEKEAAEKKHAGNLRVKKGTLLAVLVLAVAVALGLGMLRSKRAEGYLSNQNEGWWLKKNHH